MTCDDVLYVHGEFDQHIEEMEGLGYTERLRVYAECNAVPGCGFIEHLEELDNDLTWGLTSEEMIDLQVRHQAHARAKSA